MALGAIDLAVIFLYIAAMLLVGFLVGRNETIEDFLVNRRKTKLVLLVTSLVSSTVGAGFVLSAASAAYQTGISVGITQTLAYVPGLLFAAYFAPRIHRFGRKHNAHTIGDFFGVIYSDRARVIASILTLMTFFLYLALQFVAVASLVNLLLGVDFGIGLILSAVATITYVAVSGIKSDFYTDFIQFWLMIVFLFILLIPIGLLNLGGWDSIASLPARYFDPFAFGGIEFFIGGLVLGIPMLVVSMDIWQKIYSAESEKTAKRVFQLGAIIIIPFAIVPALIGMMAASSFPAANPNSIVFDLMIKFLPTGLLGLGLAGILAVIMSTVNSMLMVGTATLTKDFYKNFYNRKADEKSMMKMAKLFTILFGMLGLAAAFVFPDILQLGLTAIFISLTMLPALLGGFLWKRSNPTAAFWSMAVGFTTLLIFLASMPRTAFIPSIIADAVVFVLLCYAKPVKRN